MAVEPKEKPEKSPTGRQNSKSAERPSNPRNEEEDDGNREQVDLLNLLPEKFSEIPYLT
jgi:hypothetical protein